MYFYVVIYNSYKYRIYPTKNQKDLIDKHIDAGRLIYNLALETHSYAYRSLGITLSRIDLCSQLPDLKNDCRWLKEVGAQSLQAKLKDLEMAFSLFFKKSHKFPRFKKKSNCGSFKAVQDVKIKDGNISILKFREGIKIKIHTPYIGKIKQASIIKTKTGKYFTIITCASEEKNPTKIQALPEKSIGLDFGIKCFLTDSNGEKYHNPFFLKKSLKKLQYIQSKYSKHKGKKNKKRVAKIHEKIVNQRKDFLNKLSLRLVNNHDLIAIETLDLKEFSQNKLISRPIGDIGWGMFVDMLDKKCDKKGKTLIKISKWAPSSKTCSHCGSIKKDLTLHDRSWKCDFCGSVLNRDVNAAINIKNIGLRNYLSGTDRKNQIELPNLTGATTSEAMINSSSRPYLSFNSQAN